MLAMTRPIAFGSLMATLLLLAPLATAQQLGSGYVPGSASAGAAKAAVCMACHGPHGNSTNPMYPTLAGQNATWLESQLVAFRDKIRIDPTQVMTAMAAPLSNQDIANLAAYYSVQTPSGLEADPSYWQAGKALYRGGDVQQHIPACMACHGPTGRGNPAAGYPALEAQQAQYVITQLMQFASRTRYTRNAKGESNGGERAEIMETIAKRLTPEQMRDVASYVQGMR